MVSSKPAPVGPSAPRLTAKDLLRQFWADAYGKEVQTAATYSYTWLADQFGHICIGLIVNFAATALFGAATVLIKRWEFAYGTGRWFGLAVAIAAAAIWEWSAYNSSVKQAGDRFPLGAKLLRDNAIIAAIYMALGGVLGFAFHLYLIPAALIFAAVVVTAIFLAPPWFRQKMTWQKASLPYLFRLADAAPTIDKVDAETLQKLIDAGAPPGTEACQIVIGGPIGSGRTPIAAGIGTEFAFKKHKVRYLGLDSLLEFAANSAGGVFRDDPGPTTISYWPWFESQVVIIDGVGPMVATNEQGHEANLDRFENMLNNDLRNVAGVLKRCHTVWILGDLRPPPPRDELSAVLDEFAKAVARYCDSKDPAFVVELAAPPEKQSIKGAMLPSARAGAHITDVKSVRRVSKD